MTKMQNSEMQMRRQSPINIEEEYVKFQEFRPFHFTGYSQISIAKGTLKATNTGSTLKFLAEPSIGILRGGPLNVEYEFVEMHFHWGDCNAGKASKGLELKGSEHTFNGKSFPLELHMVHKNVHDETLNDALQHENGLCVLGFVFDVVESDMPMRGLDNLVRVINYLGKAETVFDQAKMRQVVQKVEEVDVNVTNFFPLDLNEYFTYRGSLTTGGYQEAVNWVVFRTPLAIKREHLAVFETLMNPCHEPIRNNYRATMPINNRPVYYHGEELLASDVVKSGQKFGMKSVDHAPVIDRLRKINVAKCRFKQQLLAFANDDECQETEEARSR